MCIGCISTPAGAFELAGVVVLPNSWTPRQRWVDSRTGPQLLLPFD
jgi:hypothetical protein